MVTEEELREGLTACLNVPRWVDEVVVAGPYDSLAGLVAQARASATPLSPQEIEEALAEHPRIGERASGSGTAQAFSRAEQAASQTTDAGLTAALEAGNRAYEERFGRIFLIRAAGRSRREVLDELERRMGLDPESELQQVGAELRDIALLRIEQLFARLDEPGDRAGHPPGREPGREPGENRVSA